MFTALPMISALIEEITAALCWARAARSYIAASPPRTRAGLHGAALISRPCLRPCH